MQEKPPFQKGKNLYLNSSLKNRFIKDEFSDVLTATIGVDFYSQFVQLNDGTIVKLSIKDTAGQERYNAICKTYYKKADCCLLLYAINSRKSFEKVKNYYVKTIKENCENNVKVLLLGNKADLKEKREVSEDEGSKLAEQNEYMFMESSCKDNYNVSDAFTTLIEMTNTELKKKINKAETFKIKKGKKDKKDNSNSNSNDNKCC